MSVNEMRKDYLLNRWVVIASQRKRRPTDFVRVKEKRRPTICPFCPGNEHMTPPAVLLYMPNGKKEKDTDTVRRKDWLVRCIPNLYPAFSPPENQEKRVLGEGDYISQEAVGHHEVIIESPDHDGNLGVARIPQVVHVINAYRDRLSVLSSYTYVKYVSIFRNHGLDAGASLSHAHTQIIATPNVPRIIDEELSASRSFWDKNRRCIFCNILEKERESERFIWENPSFFVFAPWASVHPFEFWILPKRHQSTLLDITGSEVKELAEAVRVSLGGLRDLLNDPSYNFGFHIFPCEHYHWHIEVYPRLAIWAGFEKSTGMFINVIPPEDAAESLKGAFQKEENNL